jgi:hypothetical protein
MKYVLQLQHNQCTTKFLMGLNGSYTAVRGHILLMDPLPSVNRAYALVLQGERQCNISIPSTVEGIALAAKSGPLPWKNGRLGASKKDRPKCIHCGCDGHTIDHCYHLHGFPLSSRSTKLGTKSPPRTHQASCTNDRPPTSSLPFTSKQCEQLLAILNNDKSQPMANQVGCTESSLSSKSLPYQSCVLDSGATNHMVNDPTILTHAIPVHNHIVQLPNGSHALVTHIGIVHFSSSLVLTNVLCIPTFHINLISVHRLCKTPHCLIIFSSEFCIIQDLHSMKMIGMGTEQDGLYKFTKLEVD